MPFRDIAYVLIGCFPLIASCGTVSTAKSDYAVTGISTFQSDELAIVKSKGLGIFHHDNDFTVGWLNEIRIYLPIQSGKCRVVLFPDKVEDVQRIISVLESVGSNLSEVCVIKGENLQ